MPEHKFIPVLPNLLAVEEYERVGDAFMHPWWHSGQPEFHRRGYPFRCPANMCLEAANEAAARDDVVCGLVLLATHFTPSIVQDVFAHQCCPTLYPVLSQQPAEEFHSGRAKFFHTKEYDGQAWSPRVEER